MTTKELFDLANQHTKNLQKKQGRKEVGISSTQVQGLIIALGMILGDVINLQKIDYERENKEIRRELRTKKYFQRNEK